MYKINLEKPLVGLLIISALLGYTISYGQLYVFHIVVILYYFALALGVVKLSKTALNSISLLIAVFVYSCITLLWTPNIINGLVYTFYLFCGITIVIAIVNYSQNLDTLDFVFKVSVAVLLINFLVGLLETTGSFRLPVSLYAVPNTFQNLIPGFDRPSGFNYNLNNFGFVFAISFPFIFLYPNRLISFLGLLVMVWFTYKLQSKGFFLSILIFFVIYLVEEIQRKSILLLFFIGGFLTLIIITFYLDQLTAILQGRAFSLFSQISRGVDLIASGDIDFQDSTSERAYFYATGIKQFFNSYGLGEGLASISSLLGIARGEDKISFHFFFLELLIDLGFIPFVILMFFYIKLITRLFKKSRRSLITRSRYYTRASGYSLITIIPASIAPSSIIYILPFWLVLAFTISSYRAT